MAVSGRARWAKDDNHGFSIGGFGIVMLFNLWGILWPKNKKVIKGTLAGTPPANAAAPSLPGLPHQFLPVGPLTVLYSHQLPLRILRPLKNTKCRAALGTL